MYINDKKDFVHLVFIKKLLRDESYLAGVLEKGSKRAYLIAEANLKEIYKIIGLTKFT